MGNWNSGGLGLGLPWTEWKTNYAELIDNVCFKGNN